MDKIMEMIKQIKAGNYEVHHEEECHCDFFWDINDHGKLVETSEPGECWICKSLWVNDTQVVMRDTYCNEMWVKGICRDDISDEIWHELDCWPTPVWWETGCSETHDDHRREALIEWLLECGYELDKKYPREFANEYVMILRECETAVENNREECEKWAKAYLYLGDATTKAFVGFKFIPWAGK